MSELTLVTAFFNIGRESFNVIPRSDSTYVDYFRRWARIRNRLVVYTFKGMDDIVRKIRVEYGLLEKTKIIVLDDIFQIEPNIIEEMEKLSKGYWFRRFRFYPNAVSNNPYYSYLMLLKNWFMKDAADRGLLTDMSVWIDFGFDHGGALYTNPEDWDFEWKYNFSDNIHLFYHEELDEKPIFEIVHRLCDSIMGCIYVVPSHYCDELWKLTKEAMEDLLSVGLYDDDQPLLLMAYRSKSEIFKMHKSDWFLPVKEYGGEHMHIKKQYVTKKTLKKQLVSYYTKYKQIAAHIYKLYSDLKKDIVPNRL